MTKQWGLCGFFGVTLFMSAGWNYVQQGQVNALTFQEKINLAENRLLKDELSDYERQWSLKGSYDQGLADGLIRSNSIGYRDGYHSAVSQMAEQEVYKKEREVSKTNDFQTQSPPQESQTGN